MLYRPSPRIRPSSMTVERERNTSARAKWCIGIVNTESFGQSRGVPCLSVDILARQMAESDHGMCARPGQMIPRDRTAQREAGGDDTHFLVHSLAVASYLGLSDLYVYTVSSALSGVIGVDGSSRGRSRAPADHPD